MPLIAFITIFLSNCDDYNRKAMNKEIAKWLTSYDIPIDSNGTSYYIVIPEFCIPNQDLIKNGTTDRIWTGSY